MSLVLYTYDCVLSFSKCYKAPNHVVLELLQVLCVSPAQKSYPRRFFFCAKLKNFKAAQVQGKHMFTGCIRPPPKQCMLLPLQPTRIEGRLRSLQNFRRLALELALELA